MNKANNNKNQRHKSELIDDFFISLRWIDNTALIHMNSVDVNDLHVMLLSTLKTD